MIGSGIKKKIKCRYNDVFLSVRVFGNGKKNVVAFHGYGQDGNVFLKLSVLHPEITIYAFDLFYHGESSDPLSETPFSHQLMKKLFSVFLQKSQVDRFDIIAFSLGGKFALSVLQSFSERVDAVYLIAPDGLRKNFWYQLATKRLMFRRIFHYFINHPTLYFKIALLLDRLKLVDGRVRKFATNEMDTLEKRKRVYNSWVYLRHLFIPHRKAARIINGHQITVQFILGKYDRIIAYEHIKEFIDSINKRELTLLDCGHSRLLMKSFDKMEKLGVVGY